MQVRDTMIVHFIQDRLDPGLGLRTSMRRNAQSAAMRRQAQQAGTKTGGLREVYGDNIMPTQLTLNHNPRATAWPGEKPPTPLKGSSLESPQLRASARIPNRCGQMGTNDFLKRVGQNKGVSLPHLSTTRKQPSCAHHDAAAYRRGVPGRI